MQRKAVHTSVDEEKQRCGKGTRDNIEQNADAKAGAGSVLI